MHNTIPEPDRTKDNSTMWQANYDTAHYENMYFNRMASFFERESNGTYTIDGVSRVATYAGALMWTVLGRPAPGICAGPTGFWSHPPSTRVNG